MKRMLVLWAAALAASCFACSGGSGGSGGEGGAGSASTSTGAAATATPESCSPDGTDGAAVGTYDAVYGGDIGWTAIVLRPDCHYCFDNGEPHSSRDLQSGDGTWTSSRRADGKLAVSMNGGDVVLTLDPKHGAVDLAGSPLYLQRDGDGFTCDGATVKR